jgi:preprotein translocase subunit SecG
MKTGLIIVQMVFAAMLVASVLLQTAGSGLGGIWSGGGETYTTKRGLEKLLFYATILLMAAFLCLSLVILAL